MERKEIVETLRSMANIYKMGGDMYGAKAQAEAVEVLEEAANMLDNDEICKSLSGLKDLYIMHGEIYKSYIKIKAADYLEAAAKMLEAAD